MKRLLAAVFLFLLLVVGAAAAEEAAEITGYASFAAEKPKVLVDQDYTTYWSSGEDGALEIALPEDMPCHALYLSFFDLPPSLVVSVKTADGQWQTAEKQAEPYYNACVLLDGATAIRLENERKEPFQISEIHLFGQGALPDWVQQWKDFTGKADLLVFSAHPDDEFLFLGGTIPYYAGERQKKVIVAYLTFPREKERFNELLDGLWLCGVREYPQLSPLRDVITQSTEAFVRVLGGEDVVMGYAVQILREYQPDVVVTHDRRGEYGHAAHIVASRLMQEGLSLAADASYRPDLGQAWQVKKLYLHLYKTNAVTMDWHQPLEAFGGKSAFEMAKEAFKCHVSQQGVGNYAVRAHGDHDCRKFGLFFSAVGEDTGKKDFFENIEP